MRLENWFISNLDDTQRQIIVRDPNENLIVQGAAGSGKTNLAIHRAVQANEFSKSYAIIVLAHALKRMISYGLGVMGLNKERIAYEWEFKYRGFSLLGEVYCEGSIAKQNISHEKVYLVYEDVIHEFKRIIQPDTKDNHRSDNVVGIDFGDWVEDILYRTFGRRVTWFYEVKTKKNNLNGLDHIPSGILYKEIEDTIDYLIIDEAQDFDVEQYKRLFIPKAKKSISLFGDSAQKIYSNQGATMDKIYEALKYRRLFLKYNYRLPKSIARVVQDIIVPHTDLISDNMKNGGNSDYPQFPKPILQKFNSIEEELRAIIHRIEMEDLDDVAILVKDEESVKIVHDFFSKNGIQTQVLYRTGKTPPFHTINTLDFTNNNLPCILTYYAAKGTEFDNIFVPFANDDEGIERNAFYVACARASHSLYISFSKKKVTRFLNDVNPACIEEINVPNDAWVNMRPKK